MLAVFLADVEEQLQAQADPQARLARADGLAERLAQPRPPQLGRGVGERAHAGQDHLRRPTHPLRVGRDLGADARRPRSPSARSAGCPSRSR